MRASLVKSFNNGRLNLATANKSLLSLYNPTVVIYVWGLFTKVLYITSPALPLINDGFEV